MTRSKVKLAGDSASRRESMAIFFFPYSRSQQQDIIISREDVISGSNYI